MSYVLTEYYSELQSRLYSNIARCPARPFEGGQSQTGGLRPYFRLESKGKIYWAPNEKLGSVDGSDAPGRASEQPNVKQNFLVDLLDARSRLSADSLLETPLLAVCIRELWQSKVAAINTSKVKYFTPHQKAELLFLFKILKFLAIFLTRYGYL